MTYNVGTILKKKKYLKYNINIFNELGLQKCYCLYLYNIHTVNRRCMLTIVFSLTDIYYTLDYKEIYSGDGIVVKLFISTNRNKHYIILFRLKYQTKTIFSILLGFFVTQIY